MQLLFRNIKTNFIFLIIYLTNFLKSELINCGVRKTICDSEIYCFGRLLHTIQTNKLFADSKEFVDKKLKYEAHIVLKKFDDLIAETKNAPNSTALKAFIHDNFETGAEFETWEPQDLNLKVDPVFINGIVSKELRDWAKYLVSFWKQLGRKFKDDVNINSHLYSAIYVPNPIIVPGGRFREFYYWDSYWIIKGLLLSNMYNTTKGMIKNFLYVVEKYSFIPNGGRIYYLNRSQPPMLIPMFEAYFDVTQDVQFLFDNLKTLEKEFDFWITHHMITVEKNNRNYSLALYGDCSKGPRPESYYEDWMVASYFKTDEEKEDFYSNIKAAAESGWDFSSRWFVLDPKESQKKANLTNTKTKSIVPVDLNAMLYRNAKILAHFNHIMNHVEKWKYYEDVASVILEAVTDVLWDEETGVWLDYDLVKKERRNSFYPSNISPLWTNCYNQNRKELIVNRVLQYLKINQVTRFLGGVPASVFYTSEQWDYPLAWPPLQYIMIMGLDNTEIREAKVLAKNLAKKWIASNYEAFKKKKLMFEKYDATVFGSSANGGEYVVQEGFGWTNGIIIELLNKYGKIMHANDFVLNSEYIVRSGSYNMKQDIFFITILLIVISCLFV